jgi:hypothetical protein
VILGVLARVVLYRNPHQERGMKRPLIVLALVGLLAGCGDQGGAASGGPAGSAGASAAGSGAATGSPTAACAEAFAPIADLEIGSLSDLGDHKAEVEPTIQSCESVADWIAGAQQVIDVEINPNTVALLLNIDCADQSLDDSPICKELASS